MFVRVSKSQTSSWLKPWIVGSGEWGRPRGNVNFTSTFAEGGVKHPRSKILLLEEDASNS